MAVTFNDIKKTRNPKKDDSQELKKERTLRPWETYQPQEKEKDLIDEIHDRIDYEQQTVRKKRLVKNDFVKTPPPTKEEKREKKKRLAQKMIILEENKKKGITP
ncbi:MAG: hypothetical protein VYD54_11085, partial [Bdellovibrionota bacterium]|nr:hypothetical protein [Bdellovibrionota bacterium]